MKFTKAAIAALVAMSITGPALAQSDAINSPFVVAINHEPDTLDPSIGVNTVISRPTLENIVEPIVALDAEGNLVPGVADFSYSDDGTVLTFTIRDGVTFHNGMPLTADDLIFSHERMAERSPIYQSRLRNFDRVEKLDERTVQFVFTSADVTYLPPRNLSVLSKAYYDEAGEAEFVANPVGTGPYKLVSYTPGQSMEMEAFEEYHGGAPDVKNVRFVFVQEDSTRVAMLRTGEADMILNVPFTERNALARDGFKIEEVAVTPTVSVQFTMNNPDVPWHDVRVRRAVAHAIDADGIVDGLFEGVPKRHAAFGPNEIGFDPELEHYAYDPERAKALLAEAGYPDGFEMPLIWWRGENAGIRETAEVVSIYLRQVGIRTNVSSLDVPDFVAKIRAAKGEGSSEAWVGITPTPLAEYFDPTIALAFTFWSQSPFAQWQNDEFDALVAQAVQTVDPETRAPLVIEATRILYADVPQIPLWNNVSVYAMKPGISYAPAPRHLVRSTIADVTLSNE
ncbi:ABC transporter substrate-binding protein [Roseinatronobacter sp. S2]|uniref:ABC transporter substrate-binding protein n=1 Tax=Roseinatronobacter sp. S2 TaxID=3035471 RepID=UPI0024109B4C|nr:ABC transporter substrate-binding protein [Roseinatronobacter sp. S2]WFE76625.1 ABC transporter substrate-binding protein [Roseinatronobacter sp. S2]